MRMRHPQEFGQESGNDVENSNRTGAGNSSKSRNADTEIPYEEFAAAMASTDLRGRINLRVEQALQRELEDIAENADYPLKSVSEVVRFCCLLGMERLRAWKPGPSLLGAIKAANACIIRDRLQCEAEELLGKMDQRVQWYVEHRAYDEAVSFIGQIMAHFESLEDDFWKRHFVEGIDKRFQQWYAQIEHCQRMDKQAKREEIL